MRHRRLRLTLVAVRLAAAAATFTTVQLSAQPPLTVDYARDVQPVLRANCYGCHGPALQNANFRVDRLRDVMPNRVGANGARIVPGNAAGSRLFARISGTSRTADAAVRAAAGRPDRDHQELDRAGRRLLDTQLDDGSWLVRSRAIPIQPYFESGFPHGPDQFISAAATNWATMALLAGVQ